MLCSGWSNSSGICICIWSTIYVQLFQESCHVREDATLSVFQTFHTRRKLFMHPTFVLVMWKKLNMFVGHLWLRFTISDKARQVSFSFLLYNFLTLHITAFIKCVCDICVILENHVTDWALIVCRLHACWMSVSCQGKWVDCPSQSGIDGTNFQGREATWWRMPFYMDLTWDMVLHLSLSFLVYFRHMYPVFSWVAIEWLTPHFLYFRHLLGVSCACILLF